MAMQVQCQLEDAVKRPRQKQPNFTILPHTTSYRVDGKTQVIQSNLAQAPRLFRPFKENCNFLT
jgi:hypothetical protein